LILQIQIGKGLELPIGVDLVSSVGTVVIFLLLLLANIITVKAVDAGAAAFFGHW
jgi:hypothetical protein